MRSSRDCLNQIFISFKCIIRTFVFLERSWCARFLNPQWKHTAEPCHDRSKHGRRFNGVCIIHWNNINAVKATPLTLIFLFGVFSHLFHHCKEAEESGIFIHFPLIHGIEVCHFWIVRSSKLFLLKKRSLISIQFLIQSERFCFAFFQIFRCLFSRERRQFFFRKHLY